MTGLDAVLSLGFALQIARISLPYAMAAMGAGITERAGVVDLAVEAKLLIGAFAAAVCAHATGSVLLGMVGGAVGGALIAGVQWLCTVRLPGDQVIVGVALNLCAMSGTRTGLQALYGEGSNSPPVPAVGDALLANPMLWTCGLACVGVWFLTRRHWFSVRWRAVGDLPEAVHAAGGSVAKTRAVALLIGGALAGVGGAQLSLSVGVFSAEMSAGRGYLALAAVILANWRPLRAAAIAVAFAGAEALNIQLQLADSVIPRELAPLLPYLFALLVLAGVGGGRRPPAALGKR